MRPIPFAEYRDRFAGQTAVVVGKGPTLYDFAALGETGAPTFFVNDAVALERHLAQSQPSFMFAHDRGQTAWFARGIRTIPVLPRDGKIVEGESDPLLAPLDKAIFYTWRTRDQSLVLAQTKAELAQSGELYTDCGTIHAALHFVWYCGFSAVRFVGCDGVTKDPRTAELGDERTGYDKRIDNASNSAPWGQFIRIRREQDRLCKVFGLDVEYWGAPVERGAIEKTSEAVRAVFKDLKRRTKSAGRRGGPA
ncbi:MAG: hypothetical protein JNL28_12400 [Planctomycetes bacterium]|nr:hypothetical protein [Planctomycetota bacterium]